MKHIRDRWLLRTVPWAILAAHPLQADVLVVDRANGPGTNFTQIQAAVNAAAEGDTLLVRDGTYTVFTVDAKSLSIVADGDAAMLIGGVALGSSSTIRVRNLALGQQVLVRGLRADTGVEVLDCVGRAWFDELHVSGAVPCGPGGVPGAWVKSSSRTTFTRCMLRGESDADPWLAHVSSPGVRVESALVQLFDCEITGSWGDSGSAGTGGPGLSVDASTVTVMGCTIVGGEGGLANLGGGGNVCTLTHGRGGPGVQFVGTAGIVRSAESTAVGGRLSLEPMCPGKFGPQGAAIAGTGTIIALPGFARHLSANSPVRAGETLSFGLGGQPGEIPLVLVSLEHTPLALLNGTLLVGLPPVEVFVLGPLPVGGEAALSFPVPSLGAPSLTCYAQAIFLDPAATLWLGAGTSVVLLDPAF